MGVALHAGAVLKPERGRFGANPAMPSPMDSSSRWWSVSDEMGRCLSQDTAGADTRPMEMGPFVSTGPRDFTELEIPRPGQGRGGPILDPGIINP